MSYPEKGRSFVFLGFSFDLVYRDYRGTHLAKIQRQGAFFQQKSYLVNLLFIDPGCC
jgi:hypothetical protein